MKAIDLSVELLRSGNVVALPTETVYGLAADALKEDPVLRIFEAKQRPSFNPLIVHLPNAQWLERIVWIDPDGVVQVFSTGTCPSPGPLGGPRPRIDSRTSGSRNSVARLSASIGRPCVIP